MQDKLNKIEQINIGNFNKRNLNNIDYTKTQFHVISHDTDEMNNRLNDAMSKAKKVEEETHNRLLLEEEKLKLNKKNVMERNKAAASISNANRY
jgi:hypothetical protein